MELKFLNYSITDKIMDIYKSKNNTKMSAENEALMKG